MSGDRAALEADYQAAHTLREAGRLPEARDIYERVAEAAPGLAAPHHWIGLIWQALGEPVEAEAAFRRALDLEPGRPISVHGLGMALLGQGRYAEGFPLLEARHQVRGDKLPLPFRPWRGEDVTGKRILIWPEEGFGDQIQHARFAKQLPARGVTAAWYCVPELAPLFAANLPGVEVIPGVGSVTFETPDYLVRSTSLPALFPSDEIPAAPYLSASAAPVAGRIGVMPFGNPKHVNDANRSLSPDESARLLAMPGAVSLRPEATGAATFQETAEIIAGLELVVTVDTAVAHLAGAMGKPVWVLLPKIGSDWRWMPDRERSPWYPSARLYRQREPGDWGAVVSRVIEATYERT